VQIKNLIDPNPAFLSILMIHLRHRQFDEIEDHRAIGSADQVLKRARHGRP
jgi:hypothetical protein